MGLKDLFAAHDGSAEKKTQTIEVEGMHCNACERLVSDALSSLGATDVVCDHESGKVSFCGELTRDEMASAIAEAGFKLA